MAFIQENEYLAPIKKGCDSSFYEKNMHEGPVCG